MLILFSWCNRQIIRLFCYNTAHWLFFWRQQNTTMSFTLSSFFHLHCLHNKVSCCNSVSLRRHETCNDNCLLWYPFLLHSAVCVAMSFESYIPIVYILLSITSSHFIKKDNYFSRVLENGKMAITGKCHKQSLGKLWKKGTALMM